MSSIEYVFEFTVAMSLQVNFSQLILGTTNCHLIGFKSKFNCNVGFYFSLWGTAELCLLQLWLESSSGIWSRQCWTNTPGAGVSAVVSACSAVFNNKLRTCQMHLPVVTCHPKNILPLHRMQKPNRVKQTSQFHIGIILNEKSVKCSRTFWVS